jgi:hypothetical protein
MKNKLGYVGHLGHVAFIGHIETTKELDALNHVFGDVKVKGCDIVVAETIRKEQAEAEQHKEKYHKYFSKPIYVIGQSDLVRKYSYEDFMKHHKDILDKVCKLSSTERKYITQIYEKIYG